MFDDGYINQRIDDGVKQVRLWAKIGEKLKAEAMVKKLMSIALDVRGEDDSQLDYIVDWISKFKPLDKDEIAYYLNRLESIRDKVNSPSHTPSKAILELS